MQQQVNQMIMQITAGIFGAKHLTEQKKQTPLSPEEEKRKLEQEAREGEQYTSNYSRITGYDVTDTKATEKIYERTGIYPGEIDKHLGWAADIAAQNVGKKYSERRMAKATKEFAQRLANSSKDIFWTPPKPKDGGDK